MNTLIESTQNPLIKRIRSVKTRKGRAREGVFWVEGLLPVMEAVEAGWDVETLVRSPELLVSAEANRFLDSVHVEEKAVSAEVFSRISDRDGPAGLGAIVSTRNLSLGSIDLSTMPLVTVLIEPQDPGNLGTIIRTAYCAGSGAVILVGNSTDPFDTRSVRASMGSLFRIPVIRENRSDGFLEWARSSGLYLIGTSAKASVNYREVDYPVPSGIVLGNEQKGIPDEIASACTSLVGIPILGTISSLNLSAAAAIIIYEAAHQVGLHS